MLRNYIKIAIRNLTRNKAFSFINIFGLAAGLATCLLILLYILDESSYDRQYKDADRLFRVASLGGKRLETWAAVSAPVAGAMKAELPEVEQATRVLTFPDIRKMLLRTDLHGQRRQFAETNGYYVDSNFFQVFGQDLTYGNPLTVLDRPNTLLLSEQLAHKFFDNENPLGRIVVVNTPYGEMSYTVTGVFNNTRNKSHIPANYFLSMHNTDMWNWVQRQTRWVPNNIFYTYVKLKQGVDPHIFEGKVKSLFKQKAGDEMKTSGVTKTVFIQPVKDIYLHSALNNEVAANGNITYLYILGSIALFILTIACINFMNLSTARSQRRAREVGIRKVMGAEKASLVGQFLGESFLMCLLALGLALLLVWILLPLFNDLTHKDLRPFDKPSILLWILGLTLLTGLLSGLYPAFYLSAFRPVVVLKGKILNSFSAVAIRKGLVVFQFTISIALVLGAIVIWQQLNFMKNQHLGFEKGQQIILPLGESFQNSQTNYEALRNELVKDPAIRSVSSGSAYPGVANLNDMLFYAEGKTLNDLVDIHLSAVENDYIETLGFQLLQGRAFSKEYASDSSGIILNETAVKKLGYDPRDCVGKKIRSDFGNFHMTMQIVGVVKDFNFESLHHEIKPFGFTTGEFGNKYSYVIASVRTKDYSKLLSGLEKAWNKILPSIPFVYTFLDEDFQRNYEKEQQTSRIVVYFTLIAVLVACLGLFGLAAFSAEQRTKEIGIRKVLGASVTDVTALLSKEFIRLVVIAILIASPLAWYFMNKWLQDFVYRTPISWWMFGAAGLLAILIAVVTVSFQAIKAALTNPVKSLRAE